MFPMEEDIEETERPKAVEFSLPEKEAKEGISGSRKGIKWKKRSNKSSDEAGEEMTDRTSVKTDESSSPEKGGNQQTVKDQILSFTKPIVDKIDAGVKKYQGGKESFEEKTGSEVGKSGTVESGSPEKQVQRRLLLKIHLRPDGIRKLRRKMFEKKSVA